MRPEDVGAAAEVSAAAFDVDLGDAQARERWQERVAYLLDTDAGGAFVAERDGRVIGAASAMLRERLWCLSLLAVDPRVQSSGAGRALLERSLDYAAGADAGLIVCSNDPRALALYAGSGFSLRPTLQAKGQVDRRTLPRPRSDVRSGSVNDLEALEPISRAIRGAPHTSEIAFALHRGGELLYIEGRGLAVAQPERGLWLLVALDDDAASALLWSALAVAGDDECLVRWITAGQDWAVDVVIRAGLRLGAYGALGVRGRPGPMRPFLPSSAFA